MAMSIYNRGQGYTTRVTTAVAVGLVVALTAAFFTDWSLLSMYLLLLLVVTFRARGLAGKSSVLEA